MDTKEEQERRDASNLATFWDEQRKFERRLPPFDNARIWADDRRMTKPHLWMQDNALHQTKVFGKVCCEGLGSPVGMTAAERNWKDNKQNCRGSRSRLSTASTAKLTTIQGAHHVEKCKRKGARRSSECILSQCSSVVVRFRSHLSLSLANPGSVE